MSAADYEAVLAAHRYEPNRDYPMGLIFPVSCGCGVKTLGWAAYEAHVAAELARETEGADETHGGNHAPLGAGATLKPGYCEDCDRERAQTAERDRNERDLDQALAERDEAQEWADRLAYAIAPIEVIGEHTSLNNPWQNALDYAPAPVPSPLVEGEEVEAPKSWSTSACPEHGDHCAGDTCCCADLHPSRSPDGLRESVAALADDWDREKPEEWHFLHGPAGDNLQPDKASPAIEQVLIAIRADLRALLDAVDSDRGAES